MSAFTFCLGSHVPGWLRRPGLFHPSTKFFYSFNTLVEVREFEESSYELDADSGGFTRLTKEGSWDRWPPEKFVSQARRIWHGLKRVQFFAIQDWMCEPYVIAGGGPLKAVGTKLSVAEHQERTVESLVTLRSMAPEIRWLPVLQGWTRDEYLRCWALYESRGFNLAQEPLIAVGSMCRRKGEELRMVPPLVEELARQGLNLHLLGVESGTLRKCVGHARQSDSTAWSYGAMRNHIYLPECRHGTYSYKKMARRVDWGNCANCPTYARRWYENQLRQLPQHLLVRNPWRGPEQLHLFGRAA